MAEKSSFFVHFSFLLLLFSIITSCVEGGRIPVRPLMNGQDLSKPLKLTFGGPSRNWTDAIPIGNGRLGATIWGGVSSETININGKCQNDVVLCFLLLLLLLSLLFGILVINASIQFLLCSDSGH